MPKHLTSSTLNSICNSSQEPSTAKTYTDHSILELKVDGPSNLLVL